MVHHVPVLPRLLAITALLLVSTGCGLLDRPETTPEPEASGSECPTWTPAPAPTRDEVLDVDVLHVETAVVIELHQQDVVASHDQSWDFPVSTPAGDWSVEVSRTREHHRVTTEALLTPVEPPPSPEPSAADGCDLYSVMVQGGDCSGLTADVAPLSDLVQVVIPRRCLDAPQWVRVGAVVWDGDHAPTYSSPELGPRVPVS